MIYAESLEEIFEGGRNHVSTIKPSDWAEKNIIMSGRFPGPLSYDRTPYTREIIDCFAPDHPARVIAFMKGAQFGGTSTILIPLIGWIIEHYPANTIMTVGHDSLIEEAMGKIDLMLDTAGLRDRIKATAQRKRASKTGDTNTKKEFSGGYLKVSAASNHKIWRQADYQIGLIDDYEAVKSASNEAGSTESMIMQRFASFYDTMKLLFICTPELDATSNIKPAFLAGDQRYYYIPCPCCHEFIEIIWNVRIDEKNSAGIVWKLDNDRVIPESVGYVCQKCAGFFTDKGKTKWLNDGRWQPTAVPQRPGNYSYKAPSLLAPLGMYDWFHYVNNYVQACPEGQPRDEAKFKSHQNLCLAETYSAPAETMSATQLQKNKRPYEIGVVPEKLSKADGNGEIVMLTCAIDMNGTVRNEARGFVDDARLDYEVLAHTETGSTYSIVHGSIGTFIPREGSKRYKEDRLKWTYERDVPNSVWPVLDEILDRKYKTDEGRTMSILAGGLDCGQFATAYAYPYLETRGVLFFGLKGDKEDSFQKLGVDVPKYKPAAEMKKLYILKVGLYKDKLSELMNFVFDPGQDKKQPHGFCNYPLSKEGLYEYSNFFEHYEAEEKVPTFGALGNVISSIWKKKTSTAQNHFFDCRVYNMAVRDIVMDKFCRKLKIENYTWTDFARKMLGK